MEAKEDTDAGGSHVVGEARRAGRRRQSHTRARGRGGRGSPRAPRRDGQPRRRWVPLPFTARCAPLGDVRHTTRLVHELETARADAGVASIEVREPLPLDGAERLTFVRHVVRLEPDIDAVEQRYAPAVRRAIRQAEASGARVRVGTAEDDLAGAFYALHVE